VHICYFLISIFAKQYFPDMRYLMRRIYGKIYTLILLVGLISGCENPQSQSQETINQTVSGDLIIFHAGSLSTPIKDIIKEFNKKYPEVNVLSEPSGSVSCARKITDLNRPCDIMASADYKVIEKMLIPEHTKWLIKFAANEMVIGFTAKSAYSDQINRSNWYRVLLQDDVAFGRSDPNSDPCGYRSEIIIRLAEIYYGMDKFADDMLNKDLQYMRPKEVDLLALLEISELDYIFIYRSVAEQHGLRYISLPDSLNLRNSQYSDFYSKGTAAINGKKPGDKIIMYGEPMIYGITILKNSPNMVTAEKFLEFLLNAEKGIRILEKHGQPGVVPLSTKYYENLPDAFKQFASD